MIRSRNYTKHTGERILESRRSMLNGAGAGAKGYDGQGRRASSTTRSGNYRDRQMNATLALMRFAKV